MLEEATIRITITGPLGVVYEKRDLLPGETHEVREGFGKMLIAQKRAIEAKIETEKSKKG